MGQVIRIDLKGQQGLRSYVCEGSVSEAYIRGLALRRSIEGEKGNVRCIRRSSDGRSCAGKHDYDPAA